MAAGLFHHSIDPSSLPQIVLEQLQDKPKEEPQNEGPWTPVPRTRSELLAGFGARAYPAVLGFMETDLKRKAPDGSGDFERQTAACRYWPRGVTAKGKSIALTMDLEGRWSRNWIPWSGLQGFWDRLFEWLDPPEENLIPAHEARVSFTAKMASVLDCQSMMRSAPTASTGSRSITASS